MPDTRIPWPPRELHPLTAIVIYFLILFLAAVLGGFLGIHLRGVAIADLCDSYGRFIAPTGVEYLCQTAPAPTPTPTPGPANDDAVRVTNPGVEAPTIED